MSQLPFARESGAGKFRLAPVEDPGRCPGGTGRPFGGRRRGARCCSVDGVSDTSRVFISCAGRDRAWAEWARWHLEHAGFDVELDAVAGDNYVERAHQALGRADL